MEKDEIVKLREDIEKLYWKHFPNGTPIRFTFGGMALPYEYQCGWMLRAMIRNLEYTIGMRGKEKK